MGPLVSVHSVGCSLSDPYSFTDMARSCVTLFAKNFCLLPIVNCQLSIDGWAHFLSHLYDPLLTSSATVRTPSTGRLRREKLDHQFWWSTLSESVRNCQRKSIYWFCHMKLHLFMFLQTWWTYSRMSRHVERLKDYINGCFPRGAFLQAYTYSDLKIPLVYILNKLRELKFSSKLIANQQT